MQRDGWLKDSSKMLNFSPTRALGFERFRFVDVNPNRPLGFDPGRPLSFDLNRDLKFRKRGVVFRGYICPVCQASVDRHASECDECGALFEQPTDEGAPKKKDVSFVEKREGTAREPKAKVSGPDQRVSPAVQAPPAPEYVQSRDIFYCPICAKPLYVGTTACPGCGTRFIVPKESKPRPRRKVAVRVPVSEVGRETRPEGAEGSAPSQDGKGVTVSWDEFERRGRRDGIVAWDEYVRKKREKEGEGGMR